MLNSLQSPLQPKHLIYDPESMHAENGNPQLEPLGPYDSVALQKPKTAHLASRWIFFNLGFLYGFFVITNLRFVRLLDCRLKAVSNRKQSIRL